MNKTKIISGILFAGLAAGLLLFAQDRPDGDKDRKGDRDQKERDVKRDRERDEPGGDRERDKPRREGDRERDRERDEPRGDRERDEPRREGDGERDGHHREIEAWLEKREVEIRSLREQGKLDQAEALAAETKKVLEQYKRAATERHERREHREGGHGGHGGNELERWVQQQERKIAELREAGKKEAAAELLQLVQRKIAEHRKNADRREHGEREHGERAHGEERMKHIHAAIEHLQAAGLHDWAKELAAQVDRGHHPRREHGERERAHGERERERPHEEDGGDLRREVEELKQAIRAIQKLLEERDR